VHVTGAHPVKVHFRGAIPVWGRGWGAEKLQLKKGGNFLSFYPLLILYVLRGDRITKNGSAKKKIPIGFSGYDWTGSKA
jgi:hypothetical protein